MNALKHFGVIGVISNLFIIASVMRFGDQSLDGDWSLEIAFYAWLLVMVIFAPSYCGALWLDYEFNKRPKPDKALWHFGAVASVVVCISVGFATILENDGMFYDVLAVYGGIVLLFIFGYCGALLVNAIINKGMICMSQRNS